MEYITVYVTTDDTEVAVLESLFQERGVVYRVPEDTKNNEGKRERYFEVAEKDREVARGLLHETGYLKVDHPHHQGSSASGKKWILIFLAALVLILVAVLIGWFMTAP